MLKDFSILCLFWWIYIFLLEYLFASIMNHLAWSWLFIPLLALYILYYIYYIIYMYILYILLYTNIYTIYIYICTNIHIYKANIYICILNKEWHKFISVLRVSHSCYLQSRKKMTLDIVRYRYAIKTMQ